MSKTDIGSIEKIETPLYVIRGEKVMLDRDLAELYEVQTKTLIQAVRRNPARFPADFMFQLSEKEVAELNRDLRSRPYAFTDLGVAMLSSVLRSKRAISVNIEIMRVQEIGFGSGS